MQMQTLTLSLLSPQNCPTDWHWMNTLGQKLANSYGEKKRLTGKLTKNTVHGLHRSLFSYSYCAPTLYLFGREEGGKEWLRACLELVYVSRTKKCKTLKKNKKKSTQQHHILYNITQQSLFLTRFFSNASTLFCNDWILFSDVFFPSSCLPQESVLPHLNLQYCSPSPTFLSGWQCQLSLSTESLLAEGA